MFQNSIIFSSEWNVITFERKQLESPSGLTAPIDVASGHYKQQDFYWSSAADHDAVYRSEDSDNGNFYPCYLVDG